MISVLTWDNFNGQKLIVFLFCFQVLFISEEEGSVEGGVLSSQKSYQRDSFQTKSSFQMQHKHLQCPSCPYRSYYTTHLKNHIIAKHSGKKPFGCSICSKRFTQKVHLQSHLRTHTISLPNVEEKAETKQQQK